MPSGYLYFFYSEIVFYFYFFKVTMLSSYKRTPLKRWHRGKWFAKTLTIPVCVCARKWERLLKDLLILHFCVWWMFDTFSCFPNKFHCHISAFVCRLPNSRSWQLSQRNSWSKLPYSLCCSAPSRILLCIPLLNPFISNTAYSTICKL